ncbi:hypothetical protein [Asanoa hainanensis]|uniref:hypothetical protein n=1 Tax=Asanoa hainanensis TaxID=560556 RepID=UPI001180809F|nr:hypothetical protein [Asanoa hainanensis]
MSSPAFVIEPDTALEMSTKRVTGGFAANSWVGHATGGAVAAGWALAAAAFGAGAWVLPDIVAADHLARRLAAVALGLCGVVASFVAALSAAATSRLRVEADAYHVQVSHPLLPGPTALVPLREIRAVRAVSARARPWTSGGGPGRSPGTGPSPADRARRCGSTCTRGGRW